MKTLSLLLSLLCAAPVGATEWHVLGPRAMAMGGAGVAVPQGPQSAYWNPGALGLADNPSGMAVPIGGHLGITGSVLKGANDLNQVSKDCQAGSTTGTCSQANLDTALRELNAPNNGVRLDAGGGAGFKFGRMSFFANNFAFVGGKPIVDMSNTGPTTIKNNTSSLQLRGISVTEIGAAYGHALPFAPSLSVGGALKAMIGKVGFQNMSVVTSNTGDGDISGFRKNARSSFAPSVDLGMIWDVNRALENAPFRPRLGLTAKDITNPRFKNPDAAVAAGLSNNYSIQGALRAGLAITPLSFWNIAADLDLTKNLTAVEGVKQQNIGLGTEVNVFNRSWINIPLRAGISKNMAEASKTALTGGFGLNFLHVNLDVGAAITPGTEEIQTQGKSKKLPRELSVGAQFALLFGGGASALADEAAASKK